MNETTPSQAEGERDDEQDTTGPNPSQTTPSQAEGERDEDGTDDTDGP
jgi:hypothetical protein